MQIFVGNKIDTMRNVPTKIFRRPFVTDSSNDWNSDSMQFSFVLVYFDVGFSMSD